MTSENQLASRLTIASYFARTHLENGLSLGASEQQILRKTGLTSAQMAHPRARILATQLADIVSNCWRFSGDELLGFTEQKLKLGMFELLAEHLVSCKTLEEVIDYMARFYSLCGDQLKVRGDREDARMRVILEPNFNAHRPRPVTYTLLIELLLLICHRFCSWLVGQVIPLSRVCFQYAKPDHHQEYRLMFPSTCEFNSHCNALEFDAQYLDLSVVRNASDLEDYLRSIPLQWFRKQSFYGPWTAQVMGLLNSQSDIESVASQLSITSRTLRRKLTREGSSFQQLKDHARRDHAINLFEQRELTIADIAVNVGFTEVSTFSRAFKQWTGVSPSTYRKHK
ncbi:MAG: AraC family transcriptional regulator [Oleiphilus sp.]|nr:MAG: AraC family transcriptional regulator [Oleiphilus sp.]